MRMPSDRRRQAVALAYQEGDQAPRLVAKGYGELAERIMAEAHGKEFTCTMPLSWWPC